jgi:hypothetical protein
MESGVLHRLATAATTNEEEHGKHEQHCAEQLVEPQATEDLARLVDTEALEPEAAERIQRDVQPEGLTTVQRKSFGYEQQDPEDRQTPQRLVEERGMKGRRRSILHGQRSAMCRVDLESPR